MRVMGTSGTTPRCVIAVAVTVALLTGCGNAGTPTATTSTVVATVPTTVTRTATTTATQAATGILAMIRKASGSYFVGRPDGEVQALKTQICGIYHPQNGGDANVQITAAIAAVNGLGIDLARTVDVIKTVVQSACPEALGYFPNL